MTASSGRIAWPRNWTASPKCPCANNASRYCRGVISSARKPRAGLARSALRATAAAVAYRALPRTSPLVGCGAGREGGCRVGVGIGAFAGDDDKPLRGGTAGGRGRSDGGDSHGNLGKGTGRAFVPWIARAVGLNVLGMGYGRGWSQEKTVDPRPDHKDLLARRLGRCNQKGGSAAIAPLFRFTAAPRPVGNFVRFESGFAPPLPPLPERGLSSPVRRNRPGRLVRRPAPPCWFLDAARCIWWRATNEGWLLLTFAGRRFRWARSLNHRQEERPAGKDQGLAPLSPVLGRHGPGVPLGGGHQQAAPEASLVSVLAAVRVQSQLGHGARRRNPEAGVGSTPGQDPRGTGVSSLATSAFVLESATTTTAQPGGGRDGAVTFPGTIAERVDQAATDALKTLDRQPQNRDNDRQEGDSDDRARMADGDGSDAHAGRRER